MMIVVPDRKGMHFWEFGPDIRAAFQETAHIIHWSIQSLICLLMIRRRH